MRLETNPSLQDRPQQSLPLAVSRVTLTLLGREEEATEQFADPDFLAKVKAKCEAAGWEPGQPSPQGPGAQNASGPHRMLAQALMKRFFDAPIEAKNEFGLISSHLG